MTYSNTTKQESQPIRKLCVRRGCGVINYKELLIKYMNYVRDCEGVTFIENDSRYKSESNFTDDEWHELERISGI